MIKYTKIMICFIATLTLMSVLSGCSFLNSEFSQLNTDERIIKSLEETYPEHTFKIVKKYDDYGELLDDEWNAEIDRLITLYPDDFKVIQRYSDYPNTKYYGIYEDEKGIDFRVDDIQYNNAYHFGCTDHYFEEQLKSSGYFEKAITIAKKNNCYMEYDECNSSFDFIIPISIDGIEVETVAEIMQEFLNCADIQINVVEKDTTFSTGEENYFSIPAMYYVFFDLVNDSNSEHLYSSSDSRLDFGDRYLSSDEISTIIEKDVLICNQWRKEKNK